MTCPRKPNSIQNASVLSNFLNGVLKTQTEKLPDDLQDAEYLFVAGFQFLAYFKTPKIAKMPHNVYKVSCIRKHLLRKPSTVALLVLALNMNIHGLRHRSKPHRFSPGW
jgi:hypothetical protein